MNGAVLSFIGSCLLIIWGIAHLVPTRSVIRSFGEITPDNRRIIAMEWIAEGVALIHIGVIAALATYVDRTGVLSHAVYWATFGVLNTLSVVSLFTGFRNSFIAYKLCPVVFTASSVLILVGCFIG